MADRVWSEKDLIRRANRRLTELPDHCPPRTSGSLRRLEQAAIVGAYDLVSEWAGLPTCDRAISFHQTVL